jgi:hypothetical protein
MDKSRPGRVQHQANLPIANPMRRTAVDIDKIMIEKVDRRAEELIA